MFRNTFKLVSSLFLKVSVKQRLLLFTGCGLLAILIIAFQQRTMRLHLEKYLRTMEKVLEVDGGVSKKTIISEKIISHFNSAQINEYQDLKKMTISTLDYLASQGTLNSKAIADLIKLNFYLDSLFDELSKMESKKQSFIEKVTESINQSNNSIELLLSSVEAHEADLQMIGERLSAHESEFLNVTRDGRIFSLNIKSLIQQLLIEKNIAIEKPFTSLVKNQSSIIDAFHSFANTINNTEYQKTVAIFENTIKNSTLQASELFNIIRAENEIISQFISKKKEISTATGMLINKTEKDIQKAKRISLTTSIIIIGSTLSIFLLLSFSLISSITNPINHLLIKLESIGKGDLTVSISDEGTDEISQISKRLNETVSSLREMINLIKSGATTLFTQTEGTEAIAEKVTKIVANQRIKASLVSDSVTQINSNVKNISDSTNNLSNSVINVAASIEQMSASIGEVTKNCLEESKIATVADQEARTVQNIMSQLGTSVQEIGNVVAVIKRVANQTNLLALNATIEAAKAGDAGKGFAVVAQEVKSLASHTTKATEEIKLNIESIQKSTDEAITAIKQIVNIIHSIFTFSEAITHSVQEQNSSANLISQSMSSASLTAQDISKTISSSAENINSVNNGMLEVDRISEETSQAITEITSGIQKLSTLGADLNNITQRFTT